MFTASWNGILFLFLLHYLTLDSVDGQNINPNTLARIINFFEQNYKRLDANGNELQYAVAINVPIEECQDGFQQENFLTDENAEGVRKDIANSQDPVYQGTELIAAGVKRMNGYSLYSEYLLLYPTEERDNSAMQNLLNKRSDSCTILYTLNSPCVDICLNSRNDRRNIFQGLHIWSAHSSIKALVFKHVWGDLTKIKYLKQALTDVMEYVPVFSCGYDNECYECGGKNGEIDYRCLISYY